MSSINYKWDLRKEEFSLELDFFDEKQQEDKLWQARTGLNPETLCGAIETVIFMSERPVAIQKIKNMIDPDIPLRVVHESIERLQKEYELKHHGLRLQEVAQGYQFRTKATYSRFIQKMFNANSFVLSPTALEVLAIVAYKQPISKQKVEEIRGVDSSHIIRALMDKRLVKVAGRSDELGRPTVYGTTNEFLEVFNLNTVDELPSEIELEELANASEVGAISEIRDIVSTGEKDKFYFDEMQELDELSKQIKDISSDTFFTKSLKTETKKPKEVVEGEEGVKRKSAFDILEEFVDIQSTLDQNLLAAESELPTTAIQPKILDLKSDPQIREMLEETLAEANLGGEEEQVLFQEEEALEKALDDAFDNMFAPQGDMVKESTQNLANLTDETVQKGEELDIDLNFLQENQPNIDEAELE